MPVKTRPYDLAEYLNSPERIEAYLGAVLDDGDPEEIAEALETVARARGLKRSAGTPANPGMPSAASDFTTVRSGLNALGYKLTLAAA